MSINWPLILPLLLFVASLIVIGFYTNQRLQHSSNFLAEYFIGSRQMGGFILAMTMVATYANASSFIGGPGAAHQFGLGWVSLAMTQVITGYFILSILGKKFAIVAREINAVTIVDFLKARYQNHGVVILSALSIILFLFTAMIVQWIGGARLIEAMIGIPYNTALFIFALVVLVYVVIGGFRAVVITDALQGVVMLTGTIIILVATIIAGGGVENIIQTLAAEDPGLITPYGPNNFLTPQYVASFWILVGVAVIGLPQMAIRAMAYKNSKAMHKAMIINTIMIGVIMLGLHMAGAFSRAIMPEVEVSDSVMPLLALNTLPPWLAGIVLAAPLAAIMSSVDSLLLTVSSAVTKDIILNYINPDLSERLIKRISVIATVAIGVLALIAALQPPDLIIWLNLFALGGLEAVFLWPIVLGLYWKKANAAGALTSIISGFSSYLLLHFYWPDPFGMHTVVTALGFALLMNIVVVNFSCYKNPGALR